ncbi:ALK and LTK ligand 2-like [Morone saxatilis]|uniref:ALK and LTK ligand 2-like n=1 Tax=Morone saxatilis TaxID=34816 RepID=UPI0015E1BF01|nr:ALK and LTK ligand 2-like [Morone saxatilis]
MSGLRKHFSMGLVLLMCTLTGHCNESAPSAAPAWTTTTTALTAAAAGGGGGGEGGGRDAQQHSRRLIEIMKHIEHSRGHHSAKTEAPLTLWARSSLDLRNLKTDRGDHIVAVFPRDLRNKEKFLKYLTGPLYFSPKCRKHAYRLYNHTRDCTIPAYFKRCARLLTRLAGSPQCTVG